MVRTLVLRSRVGARGQTVIPKPMRDAAGLQRGDEIEFRLEGERIVLQKKSSKDALDEFLNAIPKRRFPGPIDWNKKYDESFP